MSRAKKPVKKYKNETHERGKPYGSKWDFTRSVVTQAERVIKKFGGAYMLAKCMGRAGYPTCFTTVYRWTYEKPRGTGGIIPNNAIAAIMEAARVEGIYLSPEILDPRPTIKIKNTLIEKLKQDV